MKNNWFNKEAKQYKAARPQYPDALFDFLSAQTRNHDLAIDCGAGNGQATIPLAARFKDVAGVDIGEKLLASATQANNAYYLLSSASALPFRSASADLVTVAAAVHWFDLDKFYAEADRVLKPGGVLALWAYYMPKVTPEIDSVVKNFFEVRLAKHVDQRRKWIINGYDDLPFPYEQKEKKIFEYAIKGNFNRFAAVLETSSFVQREIEATGKNPLDEIKGELKKLWGHGNKKRPLTWDHQMVIGRKP